MNRILTTLFLFATILFAQEKYTIAVCATSTLDHALTCKKRISKSMKGEVFIVKQKNRYFTNLNIYNDKKLAKVTLKSASKYVLDQKPYVKKIDKKIYEHIDKNIAQKTPFINMDEISKQPVQNSSVAKNSEKLKNVTKKSNRQSIVPLLSVVPDNLEMIGVIPYTQKEQKRLQAEKKQEISKQELKDRIDLSNMHDNSSIPPKVAEELLHTSKEQEAPQDLRNKIDLSNNIHDDRDISPEDAEELLYISMKEFDIQKKPQPKPVFEEKSIQQLIAEKKEKTSLYTYEKLIIKVNSTTNTMNVFGKLGRIETKLKTYIVSTGKNSIQKPLGEGSISQVSINPVWYPTEDTKKSFAKKGIILDDVIPANHKYNYMGAAKLNLTHSVDGNTTYRIHGTLNEKTIGTNESAGCIRMKNSDVLELAKLVNDFARVKSLNRVKVILL